MGVGKTRHLNFLPVSYLSGQPFYCLPWTTQEPIHFIFLSAESDDYDWREQFGTMAAHYNVSFNALSSTVFCLDTADPRNEFVDLTDPAKVRPDIKDFLRPHYKHLSVVVVDPCTNFAPTDLNSGEEMSRWVASVKRIVLDCIPRAAILVSHHARPGKANLKDALGYDALGYAANSKNLARHANAVVNILPGEAEQPGSVNIISCPKVKRARPFKPFAVNLDESTMSYVLDPHFDLDAWKDDVEGKRSGKSQKSNIAAVIQVVQFKSKSGEIKSEIAENCDCSVKCAEKWLNKSVAEGYVEPIPNKYGRYRLTHKGDEYLQDQLGI
jgi:RecA-family ATPase